METQEQTAERPAETARQTRAQVNGEIRSIAETAGLSRAWADERIDAEATPEDARAAAFEAMRTRSAQATTRTTRAQIGTDHDAPHTRAERMAEALFARWNPQHQLSEPARAFAHMTFRDMAADCLRHAHMSTTGLSPVQIITRAHTLSDYPLIFADALNRDLRRLWAVPVFGAKQVARQRTGPDFRPLKRPVLGEAPQPELVPEAAEYPWGTIDEAQEAYRIETFGKIYGWSRQMEVNDDIGFAAGVGPRFVQAARAFEATKLAKLIDDNPTMSDDVTVFDASDHKNAKAATSTGEGVTRIDAILADLEAARLGQRKQTGLSGGLIDVTPRAVLVPPALETPMERALSQVQATSVSETNPFAQLRLVVEPRLASETKWYVIDTELDGLEYAYLEGAPGPQIEIEREFDRDVSKIKLRLDFGAGWIDHRSWFRVG